MEVYPIRNHRRKYRDEQLVAHLFVFKSTKSQITYFIECEVFDKNILALKFYNKNYYCPIKIQNYRIVVYKVNRIV